MTIFAQLTVTKKLINDNMVRIAQLEDAKKALGRPLLRVGRSDFVNVVMDSIESEIVILYNETSDLVNSIPHKERGSPLTK